ncbi:type II secretion system F family protein [Brachybacterium sp. J144]|uniref:type II secretion system F family protein n=1 Tax=Brachybacterium sp. J144 TaxID=3116487 RepID=UPI002E7860AE|nr:type II secretion system F family protein [Brachybacterium sp. J144]MEE1650889.1 type II secretion system F family protein [Brachybacterium sp. J144]
MIEQLATVIASGAGLRQAWAALARTLPAGDLAEVARAGAAGADPRRAATGALARSARIGSLGAALAVCERTGAPTAGMLQGLADAQRDLHDAALARRSAFAGPRSTARILLVLPLAGLGLGILLGGDPLRLLLASPAGNLLGATGLALTGLGWWWMRRLLDRADPPTDDEVDPSVALELIAGVLEAGSPLAHAVTAVAESLPDGPDARGLARLGTALRGGVPAALAVADLPERFAALGRSAVLAETSGADLARVLRSAALDARRGKARDAEVRAAQLAVRLVLPTGIALLPAFVALGIIPTVISLLGGILQLGAPGATP